MKESQKKFLNPAYLNYVKEEIKVRSKNWIRPARVSGYICPCCNSGDGPHGTGIMESRKYPNSFCCYSSRTGECWEGYQDIIGIIRHMNPDASFYDAIEIAAEKVGYEFPNPELFNDPDNLPARTTPEIKPVYLSEYESKPKDELIELIKNDVERFRLNLDMTDYYLRRGLSKDTVLKFGCGFAPEWEHPAYSGIDIEKEKQRAVEILKKEGYENSWLKISAKSSDPFLYLRRHHPIYLLNHKLHLSKPKPSSRFIVPISESSYLARLVTSPTTDFQKRYAKMKVGQQLTGFNWSVLKNAHSPVIVTEGEFDAMSVEEIGHPSLSLGSVAMMNRFCSYIRENDIKPEYPLIIALDSDSVGRSTTAKMLQDFRKVGITVIEYTINLPGAKDPNESLVMDRNAFGKKVDQAVFRAKSLQASFVGGRV